MENLKTFTQFINESKLNESEDYEGFMKELSGVIAQAGGHFYADPDDPDMFAISKNPLSDADMKKMFSQGRPVGDAVMFYAEDSLYDVEKNLVKAVKNFGFNVDVKRLFKIYA